MNKGLNYMKNKKIFYSVAGVLLVLGTLLFFRFFSGDEDIWLCQNNQWIKHGNPKSLMPQTPCGEFVNEKADLVQVFYPVPYEIISNPVKIKGWARGSWFFEASFPIKVVDASNNVIGSGIAQAQDDWMTEFFVPFEASINFSEPQTPTGLIVFEKDNPSGLPSNTDQLNWPVKFY